MENLSSIFLSLEGRALRQALRLAQGRELVESTQGREPVEQDRGEGEYFIFIYEGDNPLPLFCLRIPR